MENVENRLCSQQTDPSKIMVPNVSSESNYKNNFYCIKNLFNKMQLLLGLELKHGDPGKKKAKVKVKLNFLRNNRLMLQSV